MKQIDDDFNPLDIMRKIQKAFKTDNDLSYSEHAEEQMEKRGITTKDVECVLKNGSCDLERWKKNKNK